MIVLAHENHHKWPIVTYTFCGYDQASLVSSFRGSKYLPEIRSSNVYFFEYEHF